jgi:ubiquinone/menaquinone biosynthesis C-methylase UbiE
MFRTEDREKCQKLFERYYAGRKFHDTIYREEIAKNLSSGVRLLDAGCGRYLKFSKEFANIAQVVGIDLERALETNNANSPYGVRGNLDHLPFSSESFDLIISRSVVEHLEHPRRVFQEFYRVLKPGGRAVLLTPNKYDYVSLIAAYTPYRLHRALVSRIFQVPADDVYPTLYRANTPSRFIKEMNAAGFQQRRFQTINHYPAYLFFSPTLFRVGVLYERLTSLHLFRLLRGSLLGVFEKPAVPTGCSAIPISERSTAQASLGTIKHV